MINERHISIVSYLLAVFIIGLTFFKQNLFLFGLFILFLYSALINEIRYLFKLYSGETL